MTIYKYDSLFLEVSNNWDNVYLEGLLHLKSISNVDEPFLELWECGRQLIMQSYSPEVIQTVLEIELAKHFQKVKNDEYLVQGLLILKELILAMRDNRYEVLEELAYCFCSKAGFKNLEIYLNSIKQVSNDC